MRWMHALLYDPFMRRAEQKYLSLWRRELLANLRGVVLEIGAGTGANLQYYPDVLTDITLAEPDRYMRAKLESNAVTRPDRNRFKFSDAPAERLPFDNGSFDAAVMTLVLCSVARPEVSLAEVSRVLKPGGRLVFIEHVNDDENRVRARWQRICEPAWKVLAQGCHLTRTTGELIRASGFTIDECKREYTREAATLVQPFLRGVAHKPMVTGLSKKCAPQST